ncbi:tubulin binding cofactor A [Rhodotorula sp. JG-1b]|nr:tubulin binding cofactor A [Rhodotorula sp. JG-1b]
MDAPRQLTIKTGVVTRLHKELQVYRDEADKTRSTIEQMEKDAAADEYEIRQQRRVLAESERIIPDSEQRLAKAVDDLEDLLDSAEDSHGTSEEYKKASAAIKLVRPE